MEVFIALLVIFAILCYKYLTWNFNFWKRLGVAGPRPYPYAGTFPKTFFLRTSSYPDESTDIYRSYFRKHRFVGVFECREPKLMILDPNLVSDIYVKYFKNFGDNSLCETIDARNDPLFKHSPFLEKLDVWKERRSELVPAYTALKVKTVYPIIENACKRLTQFLNERIDSGQNVFHNRDIATRVIATVIFDILFGLDANAFEAESEFVDYAVNQFNSTDYDHFWDMLYALFPYARKVFPHRFTSERFTKWFIDVFTHAVQMREEQNVSRDDYLNFLIELKNRKNVPDYLLHSHAYTLFLDGFETTSYMLGFALNFLSDHSHCQDQLREEVAAYNNIGYDDLQQIFYLESFLNETTRLTPFPFPIWKTCTESVELQDYDGRNVLIEKGTKIILPINALHSHPDFYPNADKFNPEHFDRSMDSAKKLKDAGVFMPFGNGPRMCLGMKYATASIKAVLCTIVKEFKITTKSVDDSTSPNGLLFFSGSNTMIQVDRLK